MNIEIGIGTDSEDLEFQEMTINGKYRFRVRALHDCPEDARIGRSLISCKQIAKLMEEAYKVGLAGEQLNITETALIEE